MAQTVYEWKKLCDLSFGRHTFAVTKVDEHRILVTGGFVNSTGQLSGTASNECEIINVTTGTLETFPSMIEGRAEHLMLTRSDGVIFVVGGRHAFSSRGIKSIEMYDASTNTWKHVGDLRRGRRQLAGVFIDDYRILTVGGRIDASTVVNDAEVFDTRTGISTSVSPYPMNISTGCAAIVQGKPCVFAGRSGGINSDRSREIWAFENGSWKLVSTLQITVVAPTIVELPSGEIVVTGGALYEEPFEASTAIQKISDLTPARVIGHVGVGRQWHGAALWNRSRVVIVGGYRENIEITASAEFFDLNTGRVTELPPIPEARTYVQLVSSNIQPGGVPGSTVVAISGLIGDGSGSSNTSSVYWLSETCARPSVDLLEPKTLRFAGMAAVTEEGVRITPSTGTAVGRVSSTVQLDGSSFEMSVGLKLSRGSDNGYLDGGPQGADGIAILFSTGMDRTYLGRNGEGIGYDGLPNVVAIEVDAYRNPANYDRDARHVAVMVPVQGITRSRHDDNSTVVMKALPFDLTADGSIYDFNVSCYGSRLNVYASSTTSTSQFFLSVPNFNIYEKLGVPPSTPLYASITAATGKSMQEHTIVRWSLGGCQTLTSFDDEVLLLPPADNVVNCLQFDATTSEIVVKSESVPDVTVYNLTGQVVLRRAVTQAEQRIDVSVLPNGFYIATCGTSTISLIVHE